MTIRARLYFTMGAALLGFAAITISNAVTSQQVAAFHQFELLNSELRSRLFRFSSANLSLLMTSDLARSMDGWITNYKKMDEGIGSFVKSKTLLSVLETKEEKAALKSVVDLWALAKDSLDQVPANYDKIDQSQLSLQLGRGVLGIALEDTDNAVRKMESNILLSDQFFSQTFIDALNKISTISEAKVTGAVQFLTIADLGVTLFFSLLVVFIIFQLVLAFRKSIIALVKTVRLYGEGDFTSRIHLVDRGEMADVAGSINGLIDSFSQVLSEIKTLSGQASAIKHEVDQASETTAVGVEEMTANIEAIMRQVDEVVSQLTRSAVATSEILNSIRRLSIEMDSQSTSVNQTLTSTEALKRSMENISSISQAQKAVTLQLEEMTEREEALFDETNRLITENVHDIDSIEEVIAIIDEIAEQTSILSMNAAIEAAHAGEAGSGFSIVAEEIRKLAESTNENSSTIKKTIDKVSRRIRTMRQVGSASLEDFKKIRQTAVDSSAAMTEIWQSMRGIADVSGQISQLIADLKKGSDAISRESNEIKRNVEEVDRSLTVIEQLGQGVQTGIREIGVESKELNLSMLTVRELNAKNSGSIESLSSSVSNYKTG